MQTSDREEERTPFVLYKSLENYEGRYDIMTEATNSLLDFGLSQEELAQLEKSSSNVVCEGGGEGWSG